MRRNQSAAPQNQCVELVKGWKRWRIHYGLAEDIEFGHIRIGTVNVVKRMFQITRTIVGSVVILVEPFLNGGNSIQNHGGSGAFYHVSQ